MENSQRIKMVSKLMQYLCYATLLMLPLTLAWVWLNFDQYVSIISSQRGLLLDMAYISSSQLLLASVISFVPVSVLMFGVWKLSALFKLYRTGVFFSSDNSRNLYLFSICLLVAGFIKIIAEAALSVVLTMGNPPGMKTLSITFGSSEFSILFIAGVLLSIAWIMSEAHRVAKENAEFV